MTLSRAASKRNTLWSLLALSVVIVLCWGQQAGAVQACPSSGEPVEVGAPEVILDLSVAGVVELPDLDSPVGDCDQTEQMLKGQTYSADAALPACLLLMWLILGSLRSRPALPRQRQPIGNPRRRHLIFCVFRE